MLNLASLDNLLLILVFVVPGFIIVSIRSQFLTGRSRSDSRTFLIYVTVSFLYNSFAFPFIDYIQLRCQSGFYKILIWLALSVFVPAFLGFLFGLGAQKTCFYKVLRNCGLNTVHPVETAWDCVLGTKMTEQWVIVTLKDGIYFGGFCGSESFISSEASERDLYIERIYDIDNNNTWHLRDKTSMLVASGQVSRIELIPQPTTKGEDHHE